MMAMSGCGGGPGQPEGPSNAPAASSPGQPGGSSQAPGASVSGSPTPKGDWAEFAPADKAFIALMPTKPEERTSTDKLEDGSDLLHHIYIAPEKPQSYLVDWVEVPFEVTDESRKGLYDGMRDENVASRKAKTLEEKEITVYGFTGRERVDEQPLKGGSLLTKTRSILVGRRYFIVMASYFPGPMPAGVDRFLESFHPAKPVTPAGPAPDKP